MPVEQIELSDKELEALETLAAHRGLSLEEAAAQMAKECLARRMNRKDAKVIPFARRKAA